MEAEFYVNGPQMHRNLCDERSPMIYRVRHFAAAPGKKGHMQSNLTHFALHVANAKATAAFYRDFAAMRITRDWDDQDGAGLKVIWLSSTAASNPFRLVLIEGQSQLLDNTPQGIIGPLSHFGFALQSRDEVDAVGKKGKEAGVLQWGPLDAGEIIGYLCYLRDPNGHTVEFSFGQDLA